MTGFLGGLVVKNLPAMQDHRRCGVDPWVRKIIIYIYKIIYILYII